MSRLPRPHSSPDAKGANSGFAPSLKRKVVPEEDDIDLEQPTKKGPASSGFRPKPLQTSRTATNATASTSTASTSSNAAPKAVMPRPLTRPRPPVAARPTARGTSAPPVSTVRKPSAGTGLASRVPSSSATGKRTASGSGAQGTVAAPDVITHLHKRLTTLESARTQDVERLATLLESRVANAESAPASSAGASAAEALQTELITAQVQLASTTAQLSSATSQLVGLQTQVATLQAELGVARRAHEDATAEARQSALALKAEVLAGKTALATAQDDAADVRRVLGREREEAEIRVRRGERMLREAKDEVVEGEGRVVSLRAEIATLRTEIGDLRGELAAARRERERWTGEGAGLRDEIAYLRREKEAWGVERTEWEREKEGWEEERALLKAEQVRGEEERRRLHGMVMELKGNIRVFCRVRPVLPDEVAVSGEGGGALTISAGSGSSSSHGGADSSSVAAQIAYPDAGLPYPSGQKEIVLSAEGAEREWDAGMGNKPRKEVWGFGFDRVFAPSSTQADLFAEISQLAQSCTDGYNVCIFAYGQTGSGKSWTMEGGGTEETQGMIPRAVAQVFRVAEELKEKGWTYTMEGQFLEIYNETITDLLAPPPAPGDPPRKHEIHHHAATNANAGNRTSASDAALAFGTTVSDVQTPALTSPAQVLKLLAQAQSRRRVAATLMNERSSRSHSVFTLRIRGVHNGSGSGGAGGGGNGGETLRLGTLNLVDLAGSERLATLQNLNASTNGGGGGGGHGGERLKETQSINRSLSALGDVVAALGSGPGAHVPYRNSKLTYLLQNSLSGNSKTLMVLNLSPLAAHLNESLTSLRFATKVNNTTIGTAKKVQVQGGNK